MTQKTDLSDDLSDDELEQLAELCPSVVDHYIDSDNGKHIARHEDFDTEYWHPHKMIAPQWQLYAILEAVEEKDLISSFQRELYQLLEDEHGFGDVMNACPGRFYFTKAHPDQICRAVLEVIDSEDS